MPIPGVLLDVAYGSNLMEALVLLRSDLLRVSRRSRPYQASRRLQSNREHMMSVSRELQGPKLKVL